MDAEHEDTEKWLSRIKEKIREDIYCEVDGYYVYGGGRSGGYINSHQLRMIADILDEINATWDAQVQRDLKNFNSKEHCAHANTGLAIDGSEQPGENHEAN
jgi:hypothetical protein